MNTWNILYRGSLSSCNYECNYCPFAKTSNTRDELHADQAELERFVGWVAVQSTHRIGILITPWGEALVHRYYREAMTRISHLPNVYRIVIQTNLSGPVREFSAANRKTLALWATFHPSETSVDVFLRRCRELDALGIRYSVGVVGLREHFSALAELREALPPEVYLWVNAFKRNADYYGSAEIRKLLDVDPYFHLNLQKYPSAGKPCRAGETTFTVDGKGDVRRCHFLPEVIGNIYEPEFPTCLKPRVCTAATCGCHIGYVHRPELRMDELYGDGILERIPARWPVIAPLFVHTENRG